MTCQITHSIARIKPQFSAGIGQDNRGIEVDQAAVVGTIPLCTVDTMGIVAHITRGILRFDMSVMLPKAFVIEDAVAAVAFIAKGISGSALTSVIERFVAAFEKRGELGTMRTVGTNAVSTGSGIVVMAVAAGDGAMSVQGRYETRYIRIPSGISHRMEGRIRGIKLTPDVGLAQLPVSLRGGLPGTVGVAAEADLILGNSGSDLAS